jgi:exonuclease SbcD
MRILHTGDWHLGDRLGRIDRTDDLRRAVERIAGYCDTEKVDTLLVAGDLFSEMASPDTLRDSIRHLQEVFEKFMVEGGTIVAITGNHDRETFCQTLRLAMGLAAPMGPKLGDLGQTHRFYLATGPTFFRIPDRATGGEVQFALMPYPTVQRYLTRDEIQAYNSLQEKNRHLTTAYMQKLAEMQEHPAFRKDLPTVLSAHIAVQGATLSGFFRLSEEEDIIFDAAAVPTGFAYVGLGHIHRPQAVAQIDHVRYSGSVERMDLGEAGDEKSCAIVDLGPEGREGDVRLLEMPSTPVLDLPITDPEVQIPRLRDTFPRHADMLVRLSVHYTAGQQNREQILRDLDAIFPRWYFRELRERNALGETLSASAEGHTESFEETVRGYLRQELIQHDEAKRDRILARAEELMREVTP